MDINLSETNKSMANTLYFKNTNFSNILDKKKYKERKPIMAKILDE